MPPPYSCFLIGVREMLVPVEMGGRAWEEGGCPGIVGVPAMEEGIITDSLLANMKQVKDLIRRIEER